MSAFNSTATQMLGLNQPRQQLPASSPNPFGALPPGQQGAQSFLSNPFPANINPGGGVSAGMPQPTRNLPASNYGGLVNQAFASPQQPTDQALRAWAQANGYNVIGNDVYRAGSTGAAGGVPPLPLGTLQGFVAPQMALASRRNDRANQQAAMRAASVADVEATQRAATEQWLRNNQAIEGYRQTMAAAGPAMMGAAAGTMGSLLGWAGDLDRQGVQLAQPYARLANQAVQGANPDLTRMYQDIDRSYAAAASALNSYGHNTNAFASAAATALQSGVRDAMAAIQSGMNPDGSLMTSQQQQQAMYNLQGQTQRQVSEAVSQINMTMEATRAQLGMGLSQTFMSGAGLIAQSEIGAANARRQGLESAATILNQGTQVQMQYAQAATALRQYAAQVGQASILNAVNLQLQGAQTLAQMIFSNPETVVGSYQGLMSLAAAWEGSQPRWGAMNQPEGRLGLPLEIPPPPPLGGSQGNPGSRPPSYNETQDAAMRTRTQAQNAARGTQAERDANYADFGSSVRQAPGGGYYSTAPTR